MRRGLMFALAGVATVTLGSGALAGTIRVGGTGAGLAALSLLGEDFTAANPGIQIEVLPSLGTPGGLRALTALAIDAAIISRHLTPAERALGLQEGACLTTALVFASSRRAPEGIARADLPRLYSDFRPTWPDGTALKVILRNRGGSEIPYLSAAIQGLGPAFNASFGRPDLPIGETDAKNADLAERIPGSFAIMTLLQIKAQRLNLQVVAVDGVLPTAETIANKSYPFAWNVCVVLPASPSADASRFGQYINSPAGQATLRSLGTTPAN